MGISKKHFLVGIVFCGFIALIFVILPSLEEASPTKYKLAFHDLNLDSNSPELIEEETRDLKRQISYYKSRISDLTNAATEKDRITSYRLLSDYRRKLSLAEVKYQNIKTSFDSLLNNLIKGVIGIQIPDSIKPGEKAKVSLFIIFDKSTKEHVSTTSTLPKLLTESPTNTEKKYKIFQKLSTSLSTKSTFSLYSTIHEMADLQILNLTNPDQLISVEEPCSAKWEWEVHSFDSGLKKKK